MSFWGYHFLLDCSGCDLDKITNKETIELFCKTLVKRIDMVALGEPMIEYCLSGEPNEGYSLLQLITTSNITGHFVTNDRSAYIDVFSCKRFDTHVVEDTVREFFSPDKIRMTFLTRNAN